ncbi:MAG: hypothetical protein WAK55_01355 [Xanthobacteraceae bacterium]
MAKLPERENLIRDINGLKESIRLALLNIGSEPMTDPERWELLKSIGSLEKHLYDLRTRLGQLSSKI